MIFKKNVNKVISSGSSFFLPFFDKGFEDWIKPGVILMVLAAAIIFGYKASPKWALIPIILVAGFLGFIVLLRRPEIGIILLIPISFFARWEIGTGTNIAFNLTFLLCIAILGIWIFNGITTRTTSHQGNSSVSILSIIFLVAISLSLIGGNIRWVVNAQDQASLPAQLGGWLLYVLPIGLLLYMQAVIKDIRWLKIIVWIFIFLGSIYIISLFLPFNFLTRFNLFVPRSLESVYWTWLAAIVFGQLLFNKDMHILYKVGLGLLIIAIIVAGLSPDRREWTSGWLPPLLAIGTILWLRSWKMGLAATILVIAGLGISKSSIFNEVVVSTNQYSITSRFATYPIMFELIKANPIIGLGFANYSHYTYLYPILGWNVSFNSHNNYMDIIAQTGFVGLILFLGVMSAIGIRGWKLNKLKLDGFSRGYTNACLGGMVGMLASGMLGDWFLPYLYNIGIPGFRSSVFAWIFLGGLLALARIFDKQDSENPSTELGSQS